MFRPTPAQPTTFCNDILWALRQQPVIVPAMEPNKNENKNKNKKRLQDGLVTYLKTSRPSPQWGKQFDLPTNWTRHHIIPVKQIANMAIELLFSETTEQQDFIQNLIHNVIPLYMRSEVSNKIAHKLGVKNSSGIKKIDDLIFPYFMSGSYDVDLKVSNKIYTIVFGTAEKNDDKQKEYQEKIISQLKPIFSTYTNVNRNYVKIINFLLNPNGDIDTFDIDILLNIFAWLPGNILIGPKQTHDLGESLDLNALYTLFDLNCKNTELSKTLSGCKGLQPFSCFNWWQFLVDIFGKTDEGTSLKIEVFKAMAKGKKTIESLNIDQKAQILIAITQRNMPYSLNECNDGVITSFQDRKLEDL